MQSTGQTSMHFSSFVQLSTITYAMKQFSSGGFAGFQAAREMRVSGQSFPAALSTTRAITLCNSYAKRHMLFVA
jgi:hypothetical protein